MAHPPWIITVEELKSELKNFRNITLLDVREPEEYAESYIEGSILIPLGDLQSRAKNIFKTDDDMVVYCAHGVRSLNALMGLKSLGFQKLRSLEGGICAWFEQGGPVKTS